MPNAPMAPAQPVSPITHTAYGSFHQIVKAPYNSSSYGSYTPVPVAEDLEGGIVGVPYSEQISAQGGVAPYSFSIITGSLPNGTSMNSSGLISGTPSALGTYNFTVTVKDSQQNTGSQTFSISIIQPSAGNYGYTA